MNYEQTTDADVHQHILQELMLQGLLHIPLAGPEPARPVLQLDLNDEHQAVAFAMHEEAMKVYEREYKLWETACAVRLRGIAERDAIVRDIWARVRQARAGLAALERLRQMERAGRNVPLMLQRDVRRFYARACKAFDAKYPGLRMRAA